MLPVCVMFVCFFSPILSFLFPFIVIISDFSCTWSTHLENRGAWVQIPPGAARFFFSLKEKKWAVSGGGVVLPCFVLNRSHRFNHVHVRVHVHVQCMP